MSKAAEPVRFLSGQSLTARDAVQRLTTMVTVLTPLSLFEHYFPIEFSEQKVDWRGDESLLKVFRDFTELVSARLFPCFSYWDLDEGCIELVTDCIMFDAPFPAWHDGSRDPTELSVLEEAILVASGYLERRGEEVEFKWNEKSIGIDLEYLEGLCAGKRSALRWLPLAVRFFLKDTGNMWCDVSQDELSACSEWPTWSLETCEYLKAEWSVALEIFNQVSALRLWIGQKLEHRQQVERLLRSATKQRVRVGVGRPLVEQVIEWETESYE